MKRMFNPSILLCSILLISQRLCLTGETTISGSTIHHASDDHHLDKEGNLIHKRVVRKDNYLFVTLRNLDIAINKTEFFVLFVYGDWCQFSKKHHDVFKKLAVFHKNIHSKLLFGSLHIAKKDQFTYSEVVSNPTIFLYHHGTLIRKIDFLKSPVKILDLRPKFLISFEPFLISQISDRKHILNMMENFNRFLIYVSDKHVPTKNLEKALTMKKEAWDAPELDLILAEGMKDPVSTDTGVDIPDNQTRILANFLKMADMKLDTNLKYFNLPSIAPLQEFFPEHTILPGHVYLYRKKDHSLLRMENLELETMDNWFNAKNWLYHHLHPDVLAFPEPAKKRILDHHNMGLFLFLHGKDVSKEDGKLSENEKAEAELDLIAKKHFK